MNKLEYLRTKLPTDPVLEALGENGWELAAVDDGTYVFMRQRHEKDHALDQSFGVFDNYVGKVS